LIDSLFNINMVWQKNIKLAPLTTFQIGGSADYFFEAKNVEELKSALKEAAKKKLPFFILAGGSNILVSDKGFEGVVIKLKNDFINIKNPGQADNIKIEVGAGTPLSKLLAETIRVNLTGLEWAIGISGTVGGAIVGNSGAYGHSISESVVKVKTLTKTGPPKTITQKNCKFSYRESVFKRSGDIIVSAVLELKRGDPQKIKKTIQQFIQERKNKIPSQPSAGSIFKNVELDGQSKDLAEKIPKELIKGGKIGAGYLIDQCGLKGKSVGGAKISDKHANFIVNVNQAKALDVLELINIVKKSVQGRFGVELELEIRLVGFDVGNHLL